MKKPEGGSKEEAGPPSLKLRRMKKARSGGLEDGETGNTQRVSCIKHQAFSLHTLSPLWF
jgi:hypothetical protein